MLFGNRPCLCVSHTTESTSALVLSARFISDPAVAPDAKDEQPADDKDDDATSSNDDTPAQGVSRT